MKAPRICNWNGCKTILSSYNKSKRCYAHMGLAELKRIDKMVYTGIYRKRALENRRYLAKKLEQTEGQLEGELE